MSLLVIEFGVCHLSFFIWPSACTPHAPQGGSCPERHGIKELGAQVPWQPGPCPVGPAPSVPGADRSVSRRGEGGEDGAARVPCPLPGWAPATACSLSGTLPTVRNRRFTPYLFSHSCFPLPPFSAKKIQGSSRLCLLGPHVSLTCHSGPGCCSGTPKAKDLGRVGPDGILRAACPSVTLQGVAAVAHPETKADLPD